MFLGEPPQTNQVQQTYSQDRAEDGYVKNLTRLWCWRPDVLEAYFQLRTLVLREAGLPGRDVALLVAAAAAARSDSYCALAWGTRLATWSGGDAAAQVVAGSLTGLDDRETALLRWANRVATDPNSITVADVDVLRGVGLTDRQIFEVTAFVALRLAFSTVNDALGAEPDAQLAQAAPARSGRPLATAGNRQ